MGNEKETHEPIRQSVHVDCPVEDAYHLFTERFEEWWPGGESDRGDSKRDDVRHDVMESGSVTVWDPPERIEFTWNPADDRQTVTVDFRVEADGTRVTLTHYGWHHAGVATAAARFCHFVSAQILVAV